MEFVPRSESPPSGTAAATEGSEEGRILFISVENERDGVRKKKGE